MNFLVLLLVLWVEKFSAGRLRIQQDGPWLQWLTASSGRSPWFTLALAAFVLGGFAWGFWRGGLEVGSDLLLEWTLTTMALGALGCAHGGRKNGRLDGEGWPVGCVWRLPHGHHRGTYL